MSKILLTLLQCSWGILQTVGGAVTFLFNVGSPHFKYRSSIVTVWRRADSASAGPFIFLGKGTKFDRSLGVKSLSPNSKKLLVHEYGHTVQSLFLGPLFIPFVALPSFLWCNLPLFRRIRKRKNIPYSALYTEKSANSIGKRVTGDAPIDW